MSVEGRRISVLMHLLTILVSVVFSNFRIVHLLHKILYITVIIKISLRA